MSEIKVSIIVPVYNVSRYLRRCLDSCVNQTMQDIEIILINDCSPDPLDSDIMREYAERYPKMVICIWHESNMRQGAARNTGISAARGTFIYCLDSDDYIEPTLCERMYESIQSTGADMAICDTERIVRESTFSKWESNGDFSSDDMPERLKSLKQYTVWLIMVQKSLIIKNDLFFPETTGFEDIQCVMWILAAKKIVRVHEVLHHYVMQENSVTQTYNMDTYQLGIETVKILFKSNYYRHLSDEVKGLFFLYVMRSISAWLLEVNVHYPNRVIPFCKEILLLEEMSEIYINEVQHDSEHKRYVANLIVFIKKNISAVKFKSEFSEYIQSQKHLYLCRVCQQALKPYKDKRIAIWGAGKHGIRNTNILMSLGVPFELTDGNEKLHGTKVSNQCIVKSWSEISEMTDIVFISVVYKFEEIRDVIKKGSPKVLVKDFDELLEWNL